MELEYPQLAALVAVIREGSFDAAARALHVTPSAISQRVKQLEEKVGGLVVVRGTPCKPTATGEALYRHGLQVELLERDLLRGLAPPGKAPAQEEAPRAPPISIAANADSLATWLVPALATFAETTGANLEVVVDDQDHTAAWLRSGRVLGAVTAEAEAVQGCRVQALGVMRYRAVATPRFLRRWFPTGVTADAMARAPVLVFNRKDELHERFARRLFGPKLPALHGHFVPSPTAFVAAGLAGLGWGLNPEALVTAHLKRGRLRELVPNRHLDVPLYWQQWGLASYSLDTLAAALQAEAARALYPQ